MKTRSALAACLFFAACLTPEQRAFNAAARAEREELAYAPVACNTKDECEAAWGRAVSWVSSFCGWKIRTQTDYLIETDGPMKSSSTTVACRVNRVPIDAKSQRFDLTASCANMFGCSPDIIDVQANFVETIRSFLGTMRLRETLPADE